jgi:hypothetical protein
MSWYAEKTEVSSDRTRSEIEATLRRYGATQFAYGWDPGAATLGFGISNRLVRFRLPMPNPKDRRFTHTESRNLQRSADAAAAEYDRAVRQSWRALALVIKAKLEAVAAGITTIEEEFLAHVVLPNGSTVGEWARPQIEVAYDTQQMPALMPGVNGSGGGDVQ